MRFRLVLFLIFSIILSCTNNNSAKIEKSIKYREKNAVRSVVLDNIKGNIQIIGWGEDFIEINTKKRLLIGLPSDIGLFDTVFFRDNSNELLIRTKIPARLSARIDLTLYVPFTLRDIIVRQETGNLNVKKYLGNLSADLQSGNHKIDFAGDLLRITAMKSRVDLDISANRPADIILNGDGGEYNIQVRNVVGKSYLDFTGQQTNITLSLNEMLPHSMFVKDSDKRIHLKYRLDDMKIFNGTNMAISGTVGKTPEDFIVDINANGGRVQLFRNKNIIQQNSDDKE